MKLRLSGWAPLRNLADINHGLLLPILFHCIDDQGRPMLGPSKQGADTDQFRRTAYKYIPVAVEEMRQYWMPTRFKTRSQPQGGRGSSYRLRLIASILA